MMAGSWAGSTISIQHEMGGLESLVQYVAVSTVILVGRVAQSVQQLATGWMVQGLNHGGGEIFRTHPVRPWGPSSLLYNEYQVFPGGSSTKVDRPLVACYRVTFIFTVILFTTFDEGAGNYFFQIADMSHITNIFTAQ
jgi:hypothetical protein